MNQASRNDLKVRAPEGDVGTFWDAMDWADMSKGEQTAWKVLGWNKGNWDGNDAAPASEEKDWANLTPEEQEAAKTLGYNETSWDSS